MHFLFVSVRLMEKLNETLCRREQEAADLSAQRDTLTVKLTQLEEQVQSLNISLQQKEKDEQVACIGSHSSKCTNRFHVALIMSNLF